MGRLGTVALGRVAIGCGRRTSSAADIALVLTRGVVHQLFADVLTEIAPVSLLVAFLGRAVAEPGDAVALGGASRARGGFSARLVR